MQFAFVPLVVLATSLVSGIAIPASSPAESISTRDATSNAVAALQNLNITAQTPLDNIKSTLAALPADASANDKAAATSAIQSQVASLVSQIDAVTAQIKASGGSGIIKRQGAGPLATLVAELIAAISGVADSLIASLGLTAALGLLNPLVGSLNGLLLALKNLLDNLLLLVKNIVDQLLVGLSAGLAGLIL